MELLSIATHYLVPFLIIISVVVFIHEFGHYYVARRTGVTVQIFSIGFGPEILGFNDRHGTRWKLCLVPLGGFVKMLGDADATSATPDPATAAAPGSFPSRTIGQRMAIVAAGPIANFIFAIVALALLFIVSGRPFTPAVVGQVEPGSPAATAGLAPGDRITAVDGRAIASFEDLQAVVGASAEQKLTFTIERDGKTLPIVITPALRQRTDRFGNVYRTGQIGVTRVGVEFRRSDPFSAIVEATTETGRMIGGTLYAVGQMIIGARGTEELGGPLRIAQMAGEVAQDGLVPAIWFTAVLSINLGLINLFPIPMLDGGHIVIYAIEAIRGKPLTERSQEIAFRFGLAMVLGLMVFATWNDLVRVKIVEFVTRLVS